MKKTISLLALLVFSISFAQKQMRKVAAVGFMNVENLWDTIQSADYIDGTKDISNPAFHRSIPIDSIQYLDITDEDYNGPWNDASVKGKKVVRKQGSSAEFTPKSGKNYGIKKYRKRLDNSAKVISEIGRKYTNTAPAIVGLIEVENRQVVEDLVNHPTLKKYNYGIIHYNSYDYRGIDVALIYQKRRFTPTNSLKREVKVFRDNGKREYTRDVLVVTGLLDNENVAIFMNHWPSRRGGEKASAPKRNAAARVLKKEMDSILTKYPSTKLIAMGDFNDDPINNSLSVHLGAVGKKKDLSETRPYYNLMYPMYKRGVASLAYRDAPNLFDQIIVSKNTLSKNATDEYSIYKTGIYAPKYLINKEGNYKGYPFRAWVGDKFTGGYSDHFPAFIVLQRLYKKK